MICLGNDSDDVIVPVAIKQLLKTPSGENDKRTQNFLRQVRCCCVFLSYFCPFHQLFLALLWLV
jgi:hypothetical protein